MLKILATPGDVLNLSDREITDVFCDRCHGIASYKSHRCSTVSGRMPRLPSLTVFSDPHCKSKTRYSQNIHVASLTLKTPGSPKGVF